jgi:DDE superfamily endonuclease
VQEAVALLAARAPKLRQAARDAQKAGHAYVVLDGTLIAIDRVAKDRPFYSGKHRRHGMNLQVIASPAGDILWVYGPLPGSVHDKKAEWIWGVLRELEAAGLIVLVGKGYQGSTHAIIPYKGKNKPPSQKDANCTHAQLRSPGERANAQLKTWKILRKLRCCPWKSRAARQGHPRFADSRSINRMEKALSIGALWWAGEHLVEVAQAIHGAVAHSLERLADRIAQPPAGKLHQHGKPNWLTSRSSASCQWPPAWRAMTSPT